MDKVMPAVGGVVAAVVAYKVVPVMYEWDLIPGVGSPSYWERANKIRYDHYSEGIVYSPYDTGVPITEMPAESRGQIVLLQKGGGWKLQKDMEAEAE
eukprot:CAMPEP_0194502098 /NCGR_PEP_ID=MMETSP0253-20130528/24431_1 /TAXON_ID=2966 /ORGANISM="Noctiluca scintillans" /LENGTH=96 /DNA_ID=CAMNT_0039344187 /DNA_START=66 /DNA_END=356 /DNA_ORIENTATION=+